MLFNSLQFLVFFPLVTIVYALVPRKWRTACLLIASYYFYMCWNAEYLVLILVSTLVTWISALVMDQEPDGAGNTLRRRVALAADLVINLGILFFFKYFHFTVNTVNAVTGLFGAAPIRLSLNVLLPVGISFYTFQALGYTFDVYSGRIRACRNILQYALFVSFFPQLVAGPVERSDRLLTQIRGIENIRIPDYDRIASGLMTMVWGMFMKTVIADRATIIADTVFAAPHRYGSFELILGALAFTMQIYCDFNAYSTIAVGAARVLGFSLMENFNTPYFATSIADFWRRWHISLSTWFRDYVYIPLGGNRKGKGRKYVNLMITFLVSGLWHGAAMNFVVWGAIHGALQIAEDLAAKPLEAVRGRLHVRTDNFSYGFGHGLVTFALVAVAWVFFRAQTLSEAVYYIKRMCTRWDGWSLFDGKLYTLGLDRFEWNILAVGLILLLLADLIRKYRGQEAAAFLAQQNLWFRWLVIIGLILGSLVYGEYGIHFDSAQFIYFVF